MYCCVVHRLTLSSHESHKIPRDILHLFWKLPLLTGWEEPHTAAETQQHTIHETLLCVWAVRRIMRDKNVWLVVKKERGWKKAFLLVKTKEAERKGAHKKYMDIAHGFPSLSHKVYVYIYALLMSWCKKWNEQAIVVVLLLYFYGCKMMCRWVGTLKPWLWKRSQ